MAITFTRVGTNLNSTTDTTSYTTASHDFVDGRYYMLLWHARKSATLANPTVSGTTSGTWGGGGATANFNTVASASNRVRAAVYLATSTFSETITINCGSDTQVSMQAVMISITGMDTTGTLVQQDAGTGDAGTSVSSSITLASFADATNNGCLLVFGKDGSAAVTPSGSLTELVDETNPDGGSIWVGYQIGENVNPSASWTGNEDWGGIAWEIKAAAASGFGGHLSHHHNHLVR